MKVNVWPYASKMKEITRLAKLDPPVVMTTEREAYDKSFALACHYFEG
jgi:hypothetical protein